MSTACSIAPSLTKLFNHSIASGIFPEAWKHARIVPIHKKKVINLFPLTTGQFQYYVYIQEGFSFLLSTMSQLICCYK